MSSLKGKSILLTGASSGLGQALAVKLLGAGAELHLVGRRKSRHQDFLFRPGVKFYEADLSNPEQVSKIVGQVHEEIDILINCAGMSITGRVEEIPLEEFERCWRVNFESPVSLIRQFLPRMKDRREGKIVNITSGVARRALPFIAPYAAAKAALDAFTDSLRVEIAPYQLKVLLFSPGPVNSRFHDNIRHYGENRLRFPKFYGEPPEKIALRLMRAIETDEIRVTVGTRASLARHLHYWSPKLTDEVIRRFYRLQDT